MTTQNSYRLDALQRRFDLRRVYLNTQTNFTGPISWPSDASGKQRRYPVLLPVTPLEVDAMESQDVLDTAIQVIDTHRLKVGEPGQNRETIKELQAQAMRRFEGTALSANQMYDRYAKEAHGIGYSDLIAKGRGELVKQFKKAFSGVLYVHPMDSWRPHYLREIVRGLEIAAGDEVIDELLDLAGNGHVHSQYLSGLLLSFHEHGLSPRSVQLLLDAHESHHPQALDSLARLLLAQEEYVGALQCALVALQGKYIDARRTVDLLRQYLGMAVLETASGLVPALVAVRNSLDEQYKALARKHFPEFFPTAEDEAKAMLRRMMGDRDHV